MNNKVFENFLERHKETVIHAFAKQMQKNLPTANDEVALEASRQTITFFIGRILGTVKVGDPLAQTVLAAAIASGISREIMSENVRFFFSTYQNLRANDINLSDQDRQHIERMLNQSQKFFLTSDLLIVNPRNLKPKE